VRRENWYYADDIPMQVGITYIPWSIAKGTALAKAENLGTRSLYGRLEDLGYTIANIREEVTARPATRDEAEGLDLPAGVPIIDLWHTGMTADKHRSKSRTSACAPTTQPSTTTCPWSTDDPHDPPSP
jgi:GntR family transcriptional regulator